MKFNKAVRNKAKLRLALTSPSGGGKTYGALLIAKGLGGKIAVIDTERGSASLYENLVDFDVLDLAPPYTPERYIEAIKTAEDEGYDICIIDSTTHEWSGSGGCLEINETIAAQKFQGNTWSAWNKTTPRHRAFIDAMVQSKMHIIATGRSKTETAQQQNESGKKRVVKLGLKTEQRDGFEYEFTVVLDIVHDGHWAEASKDRTGIFKDAEKITAQTGEKLREWLNTGVDTDTGVDTGLKAQEDALEAEYKRRDNMCGFSAAMAESKDLAALKECFKGAWIISTEEEKVSLKAAYEGLKKEILSSLEAAMHNAADLKSLDYYFEQLHSAADDKTKPLIKADYEKIKAKLTTTEGK